MSASSGSSNGGTPAAPELHPAYIAAGLSLQANLQAGQDAASAAPGAKPMQAHGARGVTRARIRRRPARISHQRANPARVAPPPVAAKPVKDNNSELRDWIKDNAALLSNASLLISIAAIALKALPADGVLNPYIQALIFGAALILLLEMHYQWPDDLQLHPFRENAFRKPVFAHHHSRRMTAFAVLMQLATGLFVLWATLTNPMILFPLAAFGIFLAFRQWYFRRFTGIPARILGVLAMIVVLLLTELIMAVAYAAFTGGQIHIYLGDRPPT
ncbi:MAG: hypothetical protein QM692_18380 [Thermomicrobiales bacterium]